MSADLSLGSFQDTKPGNRQHRRVNLRRTRRRCLRFASVPISGHDSRNGQVSRLAIIRRRPHFLSFVPFFQTFSETCLPARSFPVNSPADFHPLDMHPANSTISRPKWDECGNLQMDVGGQGYHSILFPFRWSSDLLSFHHHFHRGRDGTKYDPARRHFA
jgi:hypothetical protein